MNNGGYAVFFKKLCVHPFSRLRWKGCHPGFIFCVGTAGPCILHYPIADAQGLFGFLVG